VSSPVVRLLLITARADIGGGPRHVDLLARHLPGHVERWIAAPNDEPYAAQWRALRSVRGRFEIPHRRFSWRALLQLAAACRRHRIAVVHSHGKGAGLYARLLRLLVPSVRVVHTFHGVHVGEYGKLAGIAYRLLERTLRPLTTAFVNVSRGERQQCLDLRFVTAERAHVIYNGIAQNAAPRETPTGAVAPVILTIARFCFQKHMALALDIADRARAAHPGWRFVWVGDGPELDALRQEAVRRALRNVDFAGPTRDVRPYLRSAAVLLSTSRWEGLPYALIEASAEGLPIVATNVVGNDEAVLPGINGSLFSPDDPDEAVHHIAAIVDDATVRKHLAVGARQLVASTFSLERSIGQLVALYDTVGNARTA